MFQYRKVLELKADGFSLRSICAATGHSRQKITEVIQIAEREKISCPLSEEITDKWLEDCLFPEKSMEGSGYRPIDFEYVHKELAKKNVTLTLLHYEYEAQCRSEKAIPYSYRSFIRHYRNFAQKHKATMRIQRKPGEILEVDWTGSTGVLNDRDTGEKVKVYVFVATLPNSQYSYVEGFLSMNLSSWISAHRHAYEYIEGVTEILVPDNLKTGVQKNTRNELILNPTYKDMASHYGTIVIPARVKAPKDKASVEGSVRTISTWIIASLRHTTCFSLDEWNQVAREKLEEFNHRNFTKREGSRWSAFLEEEKAYLSPLPLTPYQMSEWLIVKVQPDYHVSVRSQFYSVPYEYISQQVDVKVTDHLIKVFYNHMRIASHSRLYGKYGQQSTNPDHMPDNHKLYMNQTPENALAWAKEIGRATLNVVELLLENSVAEKQAINSIFSLKKILRKYTKYELEKASQMVLDVTKRPTVSLIKTTLQTNQKHLEENQIKQAIDKVNQNHGFTRGAAYYGGQSNDE
ncbi:IS21 family transposase [Alkalibacterium sp. 20]|uniref:IS21 family transposase n=1 Tax=Alkalibacterium sp. 20 TaxID=1798803 RepID=UPI0009000640|nr:IS21 family transposase [Alkalibacterium sp. 20]OJF91401.1 integrase [Alkalibacterium sp. 20]